MSNVFNHDEPGKIVDLSLGLPGPAEPRPEVEDEFEPEINDDEETEEDDD